jgi:hypothetical protein
MLRWAGLRAARGARLFPFAASRSGGGLAHFAKRASVRHARAASARSEIAALFNRVSFLFFFSFFFSFFFFYLS